MSKPVVIVYRQAPHPKDLGHVIENIRAVFPTADGNDAIVRTRVSAKWCNGVFKGLQPEILQLPMGGAVTANPLRIEGNSWIIVREHTSIARHNHLPLAVYLDLAWLLFGATLLDGQRGEDRE
jgi:hypothetical protein